MQSTFESSKNRSWFNNTIVLQRLWCLYVGGYFFIFITTLPRFCGATMRSYVFLKFFVFWSPYYGDFTKQKKCVFWSLSDKKFVFSNDFFMIIGSQGTKYFNILTLFKTSNLFQTAHRQNFNFWNLLSRKNL